MEVWTGLVPLAPYLVSGSDFLDQKGAETSKGQVVKYETIG